MGGTSSSSGAGGSRSGGAGKKPYKSPAVQGPAPKTRNGTKEQRAKWEQKYGK